MAKFKASARTLDMLGRQQIAGIPTAISELFKNAHDAYADNVEVDYYRSDGLFVLRDDGLGMTEQDFKERWLTLGTESKLQTSRLAPLPKDPDKLERPILGGERNRTARHRFDRAPGFDNDACEKTRRITKSGNSIY